jgi:hypothetical protein
MKNYDYLKKSQITDISNFCYWLHQKGVGIYASITCSKISNIPYDLIFTTKFNDSSILITMLFHVTVWICRWRMNMLVTSQCQPSLSSITKIFSKRISQSDCSIQIKLNYFSIFLKDEVCCEKIDRKHFNSMYHLKSCYLRSWLTEICNIAYKC